MAALDGLAGVAVDDASALPEGLASWALPAGTYAVFRTPFGQIGAACDEISRTWLPEADVEQAARRLFERHDGQFCPHRPESLAEIGVPVKPRSR